MAEHKLGDIVNGHVLTAHGWLPLDRRLPPPPPPPDSPPLSARAAFVRVVLLLVVVFAVIGACTAIGEINAAGKKRACEAWNVEWAQAATTDNPSKELFWPLFAGQPEGCAVTQEGLVYGLWHGWWVWDH